ncbi:hypothetical protein AKJ51_01640 [candidate division MSBL1 archaeon SCGC-AAA382A20]|uniref:C2H2-type domain-containing protein n=1 Tax=candidate division MSBL1 archaeon SCGC-AAA382A20 TaxID=1698280 RepID=A0A133VLG2_9EURY|nr:hypothetical protein AKJ51_01640 [candidate division MSBL1 archaeon SCGC-AAA382A20]
MVRKGKGREEERKNNRAIPGYTVHCRLLKEVEVRCMVMDEEIKTQAETETGGSTSKHVCEECGREFDTEGGKKIHHGRIHKRAEEYGELFQAEEERENNVCLWCGEEVGGWDPWMGVLPMLAEEGIGKICEDCQWEIIRGFPEEERERIKREAREEGVDVLRELQLAAVFHVLDNKNERVERAERLAEETEEERIDREIWKLKREKREIS